MIGGSSMIGAVDSGGNDICGSVCGGNDICGALKGFGPLPEGRVL